MNCGRRAVDRPAETLGADGKTRPAFRPRLDPEPYQYGPRVVEAVVIDQESPVEGEPIEPVDPTEWTALLGVMDAIEWLAGRDATRNRCDRS